MAEKQVTAVVEEENVVNRARGFWARNSKTIIIAGSLVILLVGGFAIYKYFYKLPNETKASETIFTAEKMLDKMAMNSSYNKDTLVMILNGGVIDGNKFQGLLSITSKYGGTASGNRAHYLVGAAYMQLKEYDKAIKHLKDFDANGAGQIESKAYLLLGHAYAEQKKTSDALSYYKKAANADDADEFVSSEALFIAANYAKETGNTKEAIDLLQKIKDKYPTSIRVTSGDADRNLASMGVFK